MQRLRDFARLRCVDYALLLTFAVPFVFLGNMVRVPFAQDAVAGLVGAKMRYLKVFTLVNVVFLMALLGFALLFGL